MKKSVKVYSVNGICGHCFHFKMLQVWRLHDQGVYGQSMTPSFRYLLWCGQCIEEFKEKGVFA